MRIGHVYLSRPGEGDASAFIALIEALHCEGIDQHVVVRDRSIAHQLMPLEGISIGPTVHTAVTASCLVPAVDVAHAHDASAGQAGLILTLTRSIPYVLTHRGRLPNGRNPLTHAIYRRAACVVCTDHADLDILRHFEPEVRLAIMGERDGARAVNDLVRVYQNSQRIPIAGSNGIQ